MNAPSWVSTFPRLGEIYSNSDCDNPDNYFELKNVSGMLLRQSPEDYYIEIEQALRCMDPQDFEQFKRKTKPCVIAKDQWGWHPQMEEMFHEARGYAFLKQQGYEEVHFIPEQNQPTPDLYGKGSPGLAFLEAKKLRLSDNEKNYLKKPAQEKEWFEVAHSLPEALKDKLTSTVQKAKKQLYEYNDFDDCRRILFLSLQLDLSCATNGVKQEIELFLSQIEPKLEIVHKVENKFL